MSRDQPLVQPAEVEELDGLADHAVGPWRGVLTAAAFEHDRMGAGQAQLAGEHQAGRPGARDHHVDRHHPTVDRGRGGVNLG